MKKWIEFREKKPKSGEDVLLYSKSGLMDVGYKGGNDICADGEWYSISNGYFTHWMPLPKPPSPT